MIFDCNCIKEIIKDIETNNSLKGKLFFEKILYAIKPNIILESGFSEYETYGNYMMTYYPDKVQIRSLRTLREAVYILGKNPSYEQLMWAKKDYDIISIELVHYKETLFTGLARQKFIRNCFRLKTLAQLYMNFRSLYRKLLGKEDFRFE